jgi:serine/threonine protein kinase
MFGTILGPYRLLAPLGAGATWEVHAAEDTRSGGRVAIKLLRNRPAPGPAWPETRETTAHPVEAINEAPGLDTPHRRQERRGSCLVPEPRPLPESQAKDALRAASSLEHPNICALYDFGDFGGRIYVVVEALEGPPLPALLAGGALETGRLLDIGVQVAAALAEAHGRGVVHGGLTAGHVHVDDAGRVKVRDFGLAGVRSPASAAGAGCSASYMAPEMARGEPIDPRADLFSFGVILYEMATGRLPFAGATEAQVIEAVLHHEPASPGTLNPRLPIGLVQLVNEALCKEPAERRTGAAGIRDRLAEIRQAPGGLDGLLPAEHVSTGSAVYGTRPGNRKTASLARPSGDRHPDTTRPRPWLPPTGE